MNDRFSHMIKISVIQWPSDVGLPAAIKAATSQAAPLFPPLLQETLYRETHFFSMSVALRAQLFLFLISLSSRMGLSRYVEVRLHFV